MIFSEGSGLNDAGFGKIQAPIRKYLESREEAYEQEDVLFQIFSEEKSENWAEGYTGLTGFDGFHPVGENGAYPQEEVQEGHTKVIVNETWKDSFAVSKEMIDDNKIGTFKKQPDGFVKGYYRTRQRLGAALLAGAAGGGTSVKFRGKSFDATCADGGALFAKDHRAKIKGAAQSNLFSNELNADTLGLAETEMQNFKGDNNELLGVAPKTLIIPNDGQLKKAAFEAVGSMQDPSSANNAFNYQFGRWNIIIWPYLNEFLAKGAKPWFLLDKDLSDLIGGLIWQTRKALEVKSVVAGNDANEWKGYARFGAGFGDWRCIACGGMDGGTDLAA